MKKLVAVVLVLFASSHAVPENVSMPDHRVQWFPCSVVKYSTPLKLSWVVGAIRMNLSGGGSYHGIYAQLEPGFGGGKVNIGYRYGAQHFVPVYFAGINLSFLQTWGNPLGDVESGQSYAGIEVTGAVFMLQANYGVFRHVAGDSDEREWIQTIGIGIGI